MKLLTLTIALSLTILLIVGTKVYSQNLVVYKIQVDTDGTAEWTLEFIVRTNDTYDELDQLQSRLISLGDIVKNVTGRDTSVNAKSMSATVSGTYVTVEYSFSWENFTQANGSRIQVGDVFQAQSFFNQLYGDGIIQIIYPSEYKVESVTPAPSRRDNSIQLLEWPGTADFEAGNVMIVLAPNSSPSGVFDAMPQNAMLIGGLVAIGIVSSTSIYIVRRRRKKEAITSQGSESPVFPDMESDEERVVRMLRTAGGSAYQSAITDHFNFSRAKTSQLLGLMESKLVIRRYQKGRDKIVVLVEKEGNRKQ